MRPRCPGSWNSGPGGLQSFCFVGVTWGPSVSRAVTMAANQEISSTGYGPSMLQSVFQTDSEIWNCSPEICDRPTWFTALLCVSLRVVTPPYLSQKHFPDRNFQGQKQTDPMMSPFPALRQDTLELIGTYSNF